MSPISKILISPVIAERVETAGETVEHLLISKNQRLRYAAADTQYT